MKARMILCKMERTYNPNKQLGFIRKCSACSPRLKQNRYNFFLFPGTSVQAVEDFESCSTICLHKKGSTYGKEICE